MNQEQNEPENSSETNNPAGDNTPSTRSTSDSETPKDELQDDYYAVDHAKKDVISTIGDGEMHDEGLVGAGEVTTDLQSSIERLTDEQDAAESHDSEQ